jgi:hypothetical protein
MPKSIFLSCSECTHLCFQLKETETKCTQGTHWERCLHSLPTNVNDWPSQGVLFEQHFEMQITLFWSQMLSINCTSHIYLSCITSFVTRSDIAAGSVICKRIWTVLNSECHVVSLSNECVASYPLPFILTPASITFEMPKALHCRCRNFEIANLNNST